MDIEEHHGRKIVCRHIFKADEIKIGSRWQGSGGSIVEVTSVDGLGWVEYKWNDSLGEVKVHEKESFAFQCRYCLIVDE